MSRRPAVLSAGEWRALLDGCIPDQYAGLIFRLAVHHGAVQAPRRGETCPVCGAASPTVKQRRISGNRARSEAA